MSVPGNAAVCREKRYSVAPICRAISRAAATVRSSGCAARTAEYSGMKAHTSCPSRRRLCTKAPATSASPPVFAYGNISELKTQSFNAAMAASLAKALKPPRENVQAVAECGSLGMYATRCSYQHRTLCQPIDERNSGGGHGGRPRRTAQGAHPAPLQAGHTLRRQIQDHRLRLVELREFRHPANRGADPVQGAIVDSAHSTRLELSARRTRRIRRVDTGSTADRRRTGIAAPPIRYFRTWTSSARITRRMCSSWRAITSTRWITGR